MKHARADDVVELATEIDRIFDRELRELEVVEPITSLELGGPLDARAAHVDTDDAGVRPTQGVFRGLRRAAAGDQDRWVVAERAGGPQKAKARESSPGVAP